MQLFKQILSEIRRGENIDLYVTVLVALGIAILNLLGIAPQALITSITLTVLGLLAVSSLGNRHQVEQLRQSFTKSIDDIFLKEFPASLNADFDAAREIWLIGVTLKGSIGGSYIRLEEKLRQGHCIKVLLVHPQGTAVEMATSRYYAAVRRDPQRTSSAIMDTIQMFCSLQTIAPDRVEIRTIQNPLTFGTIAVDPESSSGVLYLEHFPFRTVSGAMPKFVLRVGDGQWYEFFKREIYTLWDIGEDWQCK